MSNREEILGRYKMALEAIKRSTSVGSVSYSIADQALKEEFKDKGVYR